MREQNFKHEMGRAETMKLLTDDPLKVEYWIGYIRGLRRAYHGEAFGTDAEHHQYQKAIDSTDELRKHRGLGYRDAIMQGQAHEVAL